MNNLAVIMLGTGSPRPDPERNSAAQVLLIDDLPVLIDCGDGTAAQLLKAGIALQNINYLWFTHLHSDHVLGYGQFLLGGWANGRRQLTVVGPKGTRELHNTFLHLFKKDIDYRLSLGRSSNGLMDVTIIELEEAGEISCDIPAQVTARQMIHNVKTFAYRFQAGDKAVVFSGDTAPTDELVQLAKGADTLVHDAGLAANATYGNNASAENKEIWNKLQSEHCTPEQAGDTAFHSGVKQLILTHFSPRINEEQARNDAAKKFAGEIIVSKDLQVIKVP